MVRMNILFLTDELLPGGVSKYVVDLANALVSEGNTVAVASTDGPYRKRLSQNVRFIPIQLLQPNSYNKNILGIPLSLTALKRHLRQEHYDIIHTQKRYSDLIGKLIARKFNIPHVSTCHNTFHNHKYLSVFGDYIIAVSDSIRSVLIEEYKKSPERVVTIHNGIFPLKPANDEDIRSFRSSLGIADSSVVIGSVGQFIPAKDRTSLVLGFSEVLKNINREAHLIIVGDGPEKENILELIGQFGIQNFVHIFPPSSSIELLFSSVDFCVLSSIQEGFPYVILEAASLKKPFVATQVGGVCEFVENGVTGLTIPSRSPELLAKGMITLINNPDLCRRLGNAARERFQQNHTFDRMIQSTLSVYEKALHRKNSFAK